MKTKESPYGKTITLPVDCVDVECWNFTDHSKHTLPAGTMLTICHVYDATHSTCQVVNAAGEAMGLPLVREDGKAQTGYRFVIENTKLNRIAKAGLPRKTFDMVGAMMEYEAGTASEAQVRQLMKRLQREGMLGKLQGHYGRTANRLGVI